MRYWKTSIMLCHWPGELYIFAESTSIVHTAQLIRIAIVIHFQAYRFPSQFLAAGCVDNTNSDSYLVIARMRRTSMAMNTIFGITNFRRAIFLYLYYRRHPDAELEVLD